MQHPWRSKCLAAAVGGSMAAPIGGPVAAVITAFYWWTILSALIGRWQTLAGQRATARAQDGLVALTAELRSGAEPGAVIMSVLPTITAAGAAGVRTAGRVAIAYRVADVTGARLADLLDRLEEDVRATTKVHTLASAQAAGLQATSWLLAGLPVAGIVLGYGIGADPLHELLHTPIGAACASAALILQMLGLAWTQGLIRSMTVAA
jgi:tight adherence protein B